MTELTLSLWPFALVLARVLPLGLTLGGLGGELIPRAVSLSLSLALTLALLPLAGAVMLPDSLSRVLLSLLRELCIGGSFALALALALLAIGWGVRMSQASGSTAPVDLMARVYTLSAVWLALSLGGLRALVIGLAESFRDAAPGGARLSARVFALGAAQLVVDAFAAALGFALPLLCSVWLIETGSALLMRVSLPAAATQSSLLKPVLFLVAAALLLVPTASFAPEAVRTAIASARALTRALAK
ncbi:MAG: Bacterial export protein family 1 [Myxococcaceae bacterium]|nr:Bacterial export protein family 1 [Myxococcaceae bacterium]